MTKPNNKKIFYLHIPKSGGQTLATRLSGAFPIGKSDIMGSELVMEGDPTSLEAHFSSLDFIEKHVTGPVLENANGIDILTTIREPISLLVSNYLHILREPNNNLHRPASLLSAEGFFTQFGDFLANYQARYLVSAFFPEAIEPDPLRRYANRIFESLDRIRWIVPTESIDEFTMLWEIEMEKSVPRASHRVNETKKGEKYSDLLNLVQSMPHLYSLDLLLWQAAKLRYAEYRNRLMEKGSKGRRHDNSTLAFRLGDRGIWLNSGWHAPQLNTPLGTAWWAGPENFSEVLFRKSASDTRMMFSVVVVCGVDYSSIIAFSDNRTEVLPVEVNQLEERFEFSIDISGLPREGRLWLSVPQVWSPVMVDMETKDTRRQSFATCDWLLSGNDV